MDEFFLIAEIKALSNREGFLTLTSFTDEPKRFSQLKKVYIDIFGDMKEFIIEKTFLQKKDVALKFKNFETHRETEFLLGKRIYVGRKNVIKLPEDRFFIHDLIGSRVFRNNSLLGTVTDVLTLPANDVYVIQGSEKDEEILIPAIKDYVESFDAENKILTLKPGGELFEEEDGNTEEDNTDDED